VFSIIIPVFNVMDYLPECLESILSQTYHDFEIIAVDDASPDGSADVLRSTADRDPRLRPLTLTSNVGMGMARNAGLEHARGRYLLCVDADDVLAAGALAAIARRIAEADEPDVVMFGFARLYADAQPDAALVTDVGARWLVPEAVLAPDERPDLLEVFPSAWNKAYRHDYVREHGLQFPVGFYEDLPWSYIVLMTANRLATMERVCYLYRQRESGNILSTAGRRHHDLFTQYERVFDYIDSHPDAEPWRPRMVDRITRHLPAVLEVERRIPVEFRREFFHEASVAFRRHRPRGYLPTGGLPAKLKVVLIEHDRYWLFRVAQLGNIGKRRIRRRGNSSQANR
jgi:glycosyltransferase involved in cell wall biosynthesis